MLKLSLDALQILDAIDRRGSFAGAGKALHKVPSTISYTVAKLEEDLGVQLFDRIGPRAERPRPDARCWTRGGTCCAPPGSWNCGCAGWRRAGRPN